MYCSLPFRENVLKNFQAKKDDDEIGLKIFTWFNHVLCFHSFWLSTVIWLSNDRSLSSVCWWTKNQVIQVVCDFLKRPILIYILSLESITVARIKQGYGRFFIWNFCIAGAAIYMLSVDRPQPRRSTCPWNCSHVQDRQSQVRSHCSQLDTEVCHGMKLKLERALCICTSQQMHGCQKSSHCFLVEIGQGTWFSFCEYSF